MKKNSFIITTIFSSTLLFQACTNNKKIEADKITNNNLITNEENMKYYKPATQNKRHKKVNT